MNASRVFSPGVAINIKGLTSVTKVFVFFFVSETRCFGHAFPYVPLHGLFVSGETYGEQFVVSAL